MWVTKLKMRQITASWSIVISSVLSSSTTESDVGIRRPDKLNLSLLCQHSSETRSTIWVFFWREGERCVLVLVDPTCNTWSKLPLEHNTYGSPVHLVRAVHSEVHPRSRALHFWESPWDEHPAPPTQALDRSRGFGCWIPEVKVGKKLLENIQGPLLNSIDMTIKFCRSRYLYSPKWTGEPSPWHQSRPWSRASWPTNQPVVTRSDKKKMVRRTASPPLWAVQSKVVTLE